VTEGGAELPVLNIAISTALMIREPDRYSLDHLWGIRLPAWVAPVGLVGIVLTVLYAGVGPMSPRKRRRRSPRTRRARSWRGRHRSETYLKSLVCVGRAGVPTAIDEGLRPSYGPTSENSHLLGGSVNSRMA
jgi:hypothetical protein